MAAIWEESSGQPGTFAHTTYLPPNNEERKLLQGCSLCLWEAAAAGELLCVACLLCSDMLALVDPCNCSCSAGIQVAASTPKV